MLISVEELKAALNISGTAEDTELEFAIKAASRAIINYTDRDFGTEALTEERSYEYDGSGSLDIDDASAVTQVKIESSVLDSDVWTAQPYAGPVYYFIDNLPLARLRSGEMGFERNEDVYLLQHGARPQRIYVTATWGWETVPPDVQQATIWTAAEMRQRPDTGPGGIGSESVAEVARAYVTGTMDTREAIPMRAQRLLDQYRRINI